MRARSFFFIAAGILMLVAAYSIGAHRADAQGAGQFVGLVTTDISATTMGYVAITATGELYGNVARLDCSGPGSTPSFMDTGRGCPGWVYLGNIQGGPIQVQGKSMSDVKGAYRK